MTNPKTKFIFITGGVVSSLGKGLASASLAAVLQGRGFKVRLRKLDPYLNVNPGIMSPYQHGEVFITDDGTEADLDLGHYERFSGVSATKFDSITTGKIYQRVIDKERRGEYNGATIQVIPHVTNEIKDFIVSNLEDEDFVLCEIGGTVGDIEGQPYLEAIRQVAYDLGRDRVMFIHLTLLPFIPTAGELKTKPTQHSVKKLQEYGIQPDMLLCRSQIKIPENEKRKLALFCNIREENVIAALDVSNIYQVPLAYSEEGMDKAVCKYFGISDNASADLSKWKDIIQTIKNPEGQICVGVVGKYTELLEAYKSLHEAIKHGAIANRYQVKIKWIDAKTIDTENIKSYFADINAIIVPSGAGIEGNDGKIASIKYARENNIPFLGICLGMQLAVVEYARNVLGIKNANSTEFDSNCTPLVKENDTKSTRIGAYACQLRQNSKSMQIYNLAEISERHYHKYEINAEYEDDLEKAGMVISGKSSNGSLPEIVEITNHPWFVAVQFHPELKSKPFAPHPLFVALIKAAIDNSRLV